MQAWINAFRRQRAILPGEHILPQKQMLVIIRRQSNGQFRVMLFDRWGMFYTRRFDTEIGAVHFAKSRNGNLKQQ